VLEDNTSVAETWEEMMKKEGCWRARVGQLPCMMVGTIDILVLQEHMHRHLVVGDSRTVDEDRMPVEGKRMERRFQRTWLEVMPDATDTEIIHEGHMVVVNRLEIWHIRRQRQMKRRPGLDRHVEEGVDVPSPFEGAVDVVDEEEAAGQRRAQREWDQRRASVCR